MFASTYSTLPRAATPRAFTLFSDAPGVAARGGSVVNASGSLSLDEVPRVVARSQNDEEGATELLLRQFRPLLRSRMHRLWAALHEDLSPLEWSDIESQVQLFFLARLRAFRVDAGVYFPHYIERMLDLDCRAWLRVQRKSAALPFSQLSGFNDFDDDFDAPELPDVLRSREQQSSARDEAREIEHLMALRQAISTLPPPQRRVLWECCVQGRTEAEVAGELGVSRSAVRNRLASALGRLRAQLVEPDSQSVAPTRTGRARPVSVQATRAQATRAQANTSPTHQLTIFWDLMLMAKDERRPDLVGVGAGRPVLLQGTFEFPATGLKNPQLLSPKLSFTVPPKTVLGVRYLRVGIVCDSMACVSTVVNGMPHRLVPVAANDTVNIPLAIVDPIIAGSQIEIHIASESPGVAIVDVGCLQMPA